VGEVQFALATADVSALLSGTAFGWMIRRDDETSPGKTTTYRSREDTTTAERPKLSVTFTAPWDSYESDYTTVRDSFSSSYNTAYMKGTGFPSGTYNVAYFDGNGNKVATDNNVSLTGGELRTTLPFGSYPQAAIGTWHALVQPSGSTAFPSTYSGAVAAPDTYNLIANDSFNVDASALPEFPTLLPAIAVPAMCLVAYYFMRKRAIRVHSINSR
jgi:hypothetical protein